MAKEDPIKDNNEMFSEQLQTFKNSIASYIPPLSITPAQVSAQAADADCYQYVLACCAIVQVYAKQWMRLKRGVRNGNAPATAFPVLPAFPTPAVAPVAWGVEPRFRALRQVVIKDPGKTPAILTGLGLEGAEETLPDLSTVAPVLKLELRGAAVFVGWGWEGLSDYLDMTELQVDRGDGKGFVFLAMDTTPGYTDTMPLPSTPAKWTYRAMYHVGDSPVGQWSPSASIMVGT